MSTFLWGCVGAAAPEVVRWYRISRKAAPKEWGRPSYWLATAAYVALGGAFASLIAQPNGYAAFAAGLSTEFAVYGLLTGSSEDAVSKPTSGLPVEEVSMCDVSLLARARLRVIRHASYLGRRT